MLVEYVCLGCGDALAGIPGDFFQCSGPDRHPLCPPCFGDFVTHCCSVWATEDSIPLKCSVCKAALPESQVRALLQSETLRSSGIWENYSKVQLLSALQSPSKPGGDRSITCCFCSSYSEVYSPAAPLFWERFANKRQDALNKEIKEARSTFEKKTANLAKEINSTVRKEMGLKKQSLLKEKAQLDEVGSKIDLLVTRIEMIITGYHINYREVLFPLDPVTEEKIELDDIRAYVKQKYTGTPEELKKIKKFYSFLYAKSDLKLRRQLSQVIRLYDEFEKEFILKVREKVSKLLETQQISIIRNITEKYLEEEKLMSKGTAAIEDVITSGKSSEMKEAVTSKFFICRNSSCPGAFCLRCEKFITKLDAENHTCSVRQIERLNCEVIDGLAAASTRSCPTCGRTGMKDLACTHITCESCHTRFCYVCGRSESEIKRICGDMSKHNEWYLSTPASEPRCPMYLHYKYGTKLTADGTRADGDPKLALQLFHQERFQKFLDDLKSKQDPKVWEEMVSTFFPEGLEAATGPKKEESPAISPVKSPESPAKKASKPELEEKKTAGPSVFDLHVDGKDIKSWFEEVKNIIDEVDEDWADKAFLKEMQELNEKLEKTFESKLSASDLDLWQLYKSKK